MQLYKHYLNAGIPSAYQRLSWSDYDPKSDQQALQLVKGYLSKPEQFVRGGVGLVFLGEFGTGKTMLMELLLKELLKRGYSVYSTTFVRLIEMHTAGWKSSEEKIFYERKAVKSEVLYLDDPGKELETKLATPVLDAILRERTQFSRPTFMSSNFREEEIEERYGPAVASLVSESSIVHNVTGTDYRKKARSRKFHDVSEGLVRPIV
ncbi:ATP-binding protein [Streptomyces sp. CoH17]|uniref:ATP-binding protein n=1 Tax=Streptomyces sp. CoH17 TaxID=2992806 RepID=UPI002271EE06|nr:ATP-binding protein [Streptomyces sp. CoH17]